MQPGNLNYFIGAWEGKRGKECAPADNWSDSSSRFLARQFVTLISSYILSSLPEENLAKTVDWFSYLTRLLRRQGIMVEHLASELFPVYWGEGVVDQTLEWWLAQIG